MSQKQQQQQTKTNQTPNKQQIKQVSNHGAREFRPGNSIGGEQPPRKYHHKKKYRLVIQVNNQNQIFLAKHKPTPSGNYSKEPEKME